MSKDKGRIPNQKQLYVHRGMAQRSFTRTWTLAEDTEVRSVELFEDGLLTIVRFGRIVPEHHKRKFGFN